jgi:hypothetical protein
MRRKVFFFEKKKQKTFISVGRIFIRLAGRRIKNPPHGTVRDSDQKFFGSFFQKRTFFLLIILDSHATARVLEIGPGHPFADLAAASEAAQPGDTLHIFPGLYTSCAVLRAEKLIVEGAGDAGAVVLSTKICQGKALLVIQAPGIIVRHLTLQGASGPDGNGAGIRAEGGGLLTIDGVRFIGNQDGILTDADDPTMTLLVRRSYFGGNGACVKACGHAIYAGHIASLTVDHSIFRGTQAGHDIKSRAARTVVTDCDIEDGPEGTSSYLIEAPDGGALIVRGNRLEKGPRTSNPRTAIAIGTESQTQATPEITVEDNFFTNDNWWPTRLLENRTGTVPHMQGNVLVGKVSEMP